MHYSETEFENVCLKRQRFEQFSTGLTRTRARARKLFERFFKHLLPSADNTTTNRAACGSDGEPRPKPRPTPTERGDLEDRPRLDAVTPPAGEPAARGERQQNCRAPESVCVSNALATTACAIAKSIMILPQVHLRKPCYDFYFL